MISSGGNVSHGSSGKQLTVNSHWGAKTRRPLWFSTYFWPATHYSFWGPRVIGWEFFSSSIFRHIFTLLNSITWHHEARREKNLWGKVLVFALGWKSNTINENNNWTLWAWIGMKYNTKSMFVIPIVLIKCLWRALCNVHSSIFFYVLFFKPYLFFQYLFLFLLIKKKEKKDWVTLNQLQTDFRKHPSLRL